MNPAQIERDSTVVASDCQVSTELKDGFVILNFDDGIYYGLDQVGARIWQLVQEPTRVETISQRITEEYEVSVEQCEADTIELLGSLAEAGLIEVRDGAPG